MGSDHPNLHSRMRRSYSLDK